METDRPPDCRCARQCPGLDRDVIVARGLVFPLVGEGRDAYHRHCPTEGYGDMRTTVDLDDTLLARAMAAMGIRSTQAVIEEALRRAVDAHELRARSQRRAIEDLRGLGWDGDLDSMRIP